MSGGGSRGDNGSNHPSGGSKADSSNHSGGGSRRGEDNSSRSGRLRHPRREHAAAIAMEASEEEKTADSHSGEGSRGGGRGDSSSHPGGGNKGDNSSNQSGGGNKRGEDSNNHLGAWRQQKRRRQQHWVDLAKGSIATAAQAEAFNETAATNQVKAAEEETAATIQVKAGSMLGQVMQGVSVLLSEFLFLSIYSLLGVKRKLLTGQRDLYSDLYCIQICHRSTGEKRCCCFMVQNNTEVLFQVDLFVVNSQHADSTETVAKLSHSFVAAHELY